MNPEDMIFGGPVAIQKRARSVFSDVRLTLVLESERQTRAPMWRSVSARIGKWSPSRGLPTEAQGTE
jgi:hypothetical protein